MPSQYLKCDHYNATIGAKEVAKHRTPTFGDTPDLIAYAKELGWELNDCDDRALGVWITYSLTTMKM